MNGHTIAVNGVLNSGVSRFIHHNAPPHSKNQTAAIS
jgi:hypothetical protein